MNRTLTLTTASSPVARRAALGLAPLRLAAAALWPVAGHGQTATPTVQLPDFSELAAPMATAP